MPSATLTPAQSAALYNRDTGAFVRLASYKEYRKARKAEKEHAGVPVFIVNGEPCVCRWKR